MKRLFIAVPLGAPIRREISGIISGDEKLRRMPVRWTAETNLHLTLQFLGDVEEKRIPKLQAILDSIMLSQDPGSLQITKAGTFPNKNNPSILWLGFAENPALPQIRAQLDSALAKNSFETDGKPFKAHLTVGRVQRDRQLPREDYLYFEDRFTQTPLSESPLDRVTLFESRLRPGGPIYTGIYEKVLRAQND